MEERLQRIIRERDLPQFVGLRKTQISALIAAGEFPAPIKLTDTGRAKGWLEADLLLWQARRIAKRNASGNTAQPFSTKGEADNG